MGQVPTSERYGHPYHLNVSKLWKKAKFVNLIGLKPFLFQPWFAICWVCPQSSNIGKWKSWWSLFLEEATPKLYGGFLKWWYPTTIGFRTKNDHFGVFLRSHYLRKHPYRCSVFQPFSVFFRIERRQCVSIWAGLLVPLCEVWLF